MSQLDLAIRGGTLVLPDRVEQQDVGIVGGKIVSIAPDLTGAREVIDATGLHVFSGVIDPHVHFNEPGRADWEGIATGSQALAAGGGTLYFDMPLNCHPPTTNAASFEEKAKTARASSVTDFALWGGLVPGNVDDLEGLSECGAIGFKAFMANSGIDDFPCVDDATLRAGMKRAASLKKIVAVHAESEPMTRALMMERIQAGRSSIRDYLDSRPIAAELEAIRQAIDIAGETGCSLHVVHVSSGEGVRLVAAAMQSGVDVTCETCPHYLALTEEDVVRIGALAKCAPPLRSPQTQADLWSEMDNICLIGSDHSPSPPEMKRDANFFNIWGGISGIQHTLPILLTQGHLNRKMALHTIGRLLSNNAARRFKLPHRKGALAINADADIALVDLSQSFLIDAAGLFYKHRQTPYAGQRLNGRVIRTILRGTTIFKDGKIVSKPLGELVI